MEQWEYKTVLEFTIHIDLNKYGQDGWELVTILMLANGEIYYYFKRKK